MEIIFYNLYGPYFFLSFLYQKKNIFQHLKYSNHSLDCRTIPTSSTISRPVMKPFILMIKKSLSSFELFIKACNTT